MLTFSSMAYMFVKKTAYKAILDRFLLTLYFTEEFHDSHNAKNENKDPVHGLHAYLKQWNFLSSMNAWAWKWHFRGVCVCLFDCFNLNDFG